MSGHGLIPAEACDRTHPDHEWWVNGRGWCYDPDCPDHTYGRPTESKPEPTTEVP